MKFIIFTGFIFYIGLGFAEYPRQFQVCTITLNSQDEMSVFKDNLSPAQFRFIELAPQSHQWESYDGQSWFSQACKNKDVQCDLLIISGHFAGTFFGARHNHILSVYEMEKIACQNQCPRIFENLKEVFLFGCNTMAGKGRVYRTPAAYLNVLVQEHSIPQDVAEVIVASRYSIFDPTFREKMEHVFSPKTQIYGFMEISPYGSQARAPLHKYFSSIRSQYGNYYQYLISNFYNTTNRTRRINPYFSDAFNPISLTHQSFGMSSTHPRYDTYEKLCTLYSNQIPVLQQMEVIYELMKEGEGLFAFSAIQQFLLHQKEDLNSQALELFQKIRSMRSVEKQFKSAYSSLTSRLVYMKSKILRFLKVMSWVDKDFYQRELRKNLLPAIQSSTLQSFDILNALVQEDQLNPIDIPIGYLDLNRNYLKNIWSVLIVDTLRFSHPNIQEDLINYCLDQIENNLVICYQVLKTLGHIKAHEPYVLNIMSEFLESEHPGLVYYATYGLAYLGVQNSGIQFKIVKNLEHPNGWIRLQSLKALDYLNLVESSRGVQSRIEHLLLEEEESRIQKTAESILQTIQ